jgi:hypothetical protein
VIGDTIGFPGTILRARVDRVQLRTDDRRGRRVPRGSAGTSGNVPSFKESVREVGVTRGVVVILIVLGAGFRVYATNECRAAAQVKTLVIAQD